MSDLSKLEKLAQIVREKQAARASLHEELKLTQQASEVLQGKLVQASYDLADAWRAVVEEAAGPQTKHDMCLIQMNTGIKLEGDS
jgi:hypothetical protein